MPSISIPVAIGGAALIGGATTLIASGNASDAATQGAQIQANSADRSAQIQSDAALKAAQLQADSANKASQLQADTANRNADLQSAATNRALDISQQQYDTTRGDYAPWRTAGASALGQQTNLLGLNGNDAQTNAFSQFRADPGYQYTVDQATKAVQNSAAARGLLTSGATIKAIQDRAANLADQGYGNYFNRLAGVAGTGQTATTNIANLGAQTAANEGNVILSGANSRASSYTAGANAGAAGLIGAGNAGAAGLTNSASAIGQGYLTSGNAIANGYNNAANAFTGGLNGFTGALNNGLNNYFAYKGFGGGGSPGSWNQGTSEATWLGGA